MTVITDMSYQPLWIDISKHQGPISFDKIAAQKDENFVHGIWSRAGWGEDGGYIDQTFERNWSETKRIERMRSSYWAYWDWYPLRHQLDLWFKANPKIDIIPRMWDLEVEMAHAQFLSEQTWLASEEVFRRDGKRFIIYSSEAILERTLCKYWTAEQLNKHKFLLAQYDLNNPKDPSTWGEYLGIRVPELVRPENILWKQTTSQLEIYPGSGKVDRDRWIWTDDETMLDDLDEFWGEGEPQPPPLNLDDVIKQLNDLAQHVEETYETKEAIAELYVGDQVFQEVEQALIDDISALQKQVLNLQKGLVLEENKTNEMQAAIEVLSKRIDGLAGGHDHPEWMKNLGLVKPNQIEDDNG